jgi:hypothetical protein
LGRLIIIIIIIIILIHLWGILNWYENSPGKKLKYTSDTGNEFEKRQNVIN